ncbi:penicillin-binding protein 1C [Pseudorhodoferax sp.]|uniref:penicillin-binding protein 1C n=1 Tax=Pseudorhodoferax sp. TaxID=1993553 RepID=UPI0039E691D1
MTRRRCQAAAAACLFAAAVAAHALPSYDEVRAAHRPSETLVLARDGQLLQRVRTDAGVRRGEWVALDQVSPALRTALVLGEDRRFWQHGGVDWRAVPAAAWANLWNTRTRGASTLTMQLAGLLDADWRAGPGGRSLPQKLGQAVAAQRLERHWRKDQILEAYLNLVPLRGEIVGIDALARSLFGKAPHALDAREAAIAAALVRGPNAAPAVVAQRACAVLRLATDAGADCPALALVTQAALQRRAWPASEGIAPHLARRLLREQAPAGAASVRSSLDAGLQRFALQQLGRQLRELRGRQVEDGAVVVLDNASGEVRAWVGSSGALSRAAEVDGVLAPRQPGSTLKPFLYAQAIAERRLTAASLLEDAPTAIPTPAGLYIPQNYDRRFKGWVSVRTALAASLNVPAVRTLVMVSPDAFAAQLGALGLALPQPGAYYGTSLALGSAEVTLLALANAYRALADGGRWSPVRLTPPPGPPQRRPALDAGAAFIVGDILADPLARAPTFGTDSVLATRGWAAVKTGTSKDMRDNWAVGWSDRYTVGVWVGNAGGGPMHAVSGTSGAAPVWAALMQYLHRGAASRAPAAPAGLEQAAVRFGDGLEAARREWFLPGTAQPEFALSGAPGDRRAAPRILAPVDGSIVALDPDIPPGRQRLQLRAQGAQLHWRLDDRPLGRGAELAWLPWPGRHRVQLTDARGQVLDEVRIEVRGAEAVAARPR